MKKAIIIILISIFLCFVTFSGSDAAAKAQTDSVTVPIIMYHSIYKTKSLLGKFVISPDEFESDLKYLKKEGYTTIWIQDLVAYVYDGKPLPEKPVVLTFDDGNRGEYLYALPLLEKYDMKAVCSVIGSLADKYTAENCDSETFPHLTWKQINSMISSGRFEIQNHSYNLHCDGRTGAARCGGESCAAYEKRFREDISKMQNRVCEMASVTPAAFTYPYGKFCAESESILKDIGIKASLTCIEGINEIKKGEPDCLYKLKRKIRPHGKPLYLPVS